MGNPNCFCTIVKSETEQNFLQIPIVFYDGFSLQVTSAHTHQHCNEAHSFTATTVSNLEDGTFLPQWHSHQSTVKSSAHHNI